MRFLVGLLFAASLWPQALPLGSRPIVSGGGGTAPAYVNGAANQVFSGTTNAVARSSVTSGNLIIGSVSWQSATSTLNSVAGTGACNGTFTLLNNPTRNTGATASMASFWFVANGTGTCTVTATFSAGGVSDIGIMQVSGQAASNPIDQSTVNGTLGFGAYTTANSMTSGNVTTTQDNEFIFGMAYFTNIGATTDWVAGTGESLRDVGGSIQLLSKTQASMGAIASTASQSNGANSGYPLVSIITVKHP